jgi:hypothetical protein
MVILDTRAKIRPGYFVRVKALDFVTEKQPDGASRGIELEYWGIVTRAEMIEGIERIWVDHCTHSYRTNEVGIINPFLYGDKLVIPNPSGTKYFRAEVIATKDSLVWYRMMSEKIEWEQADNVSMIANHIIRQGKRVDFDELWGEV